MIGLMVLCLLFAVGAPLVDKVIEWTDSEDYFLELLGFDE